MRMACRYVLMALDAMGDAGQVEFHIRTSIDPVLVRPVGESLDYAVIMPMQP